MIERQIPIGSGFGPRTTADEVLGGRDLSGKLAIVTGGYSGLGLETTRAFATAGARVIVAARRLAAAEAAVARIPGVHVQPLDLADLKNVSAFADRIVRSGQHVDILVNNAGIMACPEARVGPGWEAQLATNHLGHYALVNQLWPALVGGARVIAVSSRAHGISGIRWDDIQLTHGYERWLAYGQSKTANVLFAVHLDARGRAAGVRAFAVHPGSILTPLQRHLSREEMVAAGWIDQTGRLIDATFKSPQQGAATQAWAATSAQLGGRGGLYCEDCEIAAVGDGNEPGVRRYAIDAEQAARLWALSAELTGLDVFERDRVG